MLFPVASHVIGDDLLAMVDAFEKGDLEKARALHIKMYPIMKGMFFIASPIPVKTAVSPYRPAWRLFASHCGTIGRRKRITYTRC